LQQICRKDTHESAAAQTTAGTPVWLCTHSTQHNRCTIRHDPDKSMEAFLMENIFGEQPQANPRDVLARRMLYL